MHEIPVGLGHQFLDALLAAGEHQLLELAVRGQQHIRRRCLEGHAALGADDGVAEMNAAADTEGCGERLERLDDGHGRKRLAVECDRASLVEGQHVTLRSARLREGVARQEPGVLGNAAGGSECFLAADGHAPQAAVDRVFRARGGHRQAALLQIVEFVLAFESLIPHRRQHLQVRRQRAQRHLEAHLVVAGRGTAVRDHVRPEPVCHAGDGLRLHDALGADTQGI